MPDLEKFNLRFIKFELKVMYENVFLCLIFALLGLDYNRVQIFVIACAEKAFGFA